MDVQKRLVKIASRLDAFQKDAARVYHGQVGEVRGAAPGQLFVKDGDDPAFTDPKMKGWAITPQDKFKFRLRPGTLVQYKVIDPEDQFVEIVRRLGSV